MSTGAILLLLGGAYLIGTWVLVLLYKAAGTPARNQAGCIELAFGLFALCVIVYVAVTLLWEWLTTLGGG